jgi:hypothetical protein
MYFDFYSLFCSTVYYLWLPLLLLRMIFVCCSGLVQDKHDGDGDNKDG